MTVDWRPQFLEGLFNTGQLVPPKPLIQERKQTWKTRGSLRASLRGDMATLLLYPFSHTAQPQYDLGGSGPKKVDTRLPTAPDKGNPIHISS